MGRRKRKRRVRGKWVGRKEKSQTKSGRRKRRIEVKKSEASWRRKKKEKV